MSLRRRSRWFDSVLAALEGFRIHQSGRSAALVAHFGFISIFPLLLVFTTILGFVLEGDDELSKQIVDSAFAKLPLIGSTLASDPDQLTGSAVALVLGLLLALWSAMKAFVAVQGGLDNIHEIPLDDRTGFVTSRIKALGGIVFVGFSQVAVAVLAGFVGASDFRLLGKMLLLVVAAVFNTMVLAFMFRWLTSAAVTWGSIRPGALVGGVVFTALQLVGTTVVARSIANAESVYGDFAAIIALLAWLSIHATVALLGAEWNRALSVQRANSTPLAPPALAPPALA